MRGLCLGLRAGRVSSEQPGFPHEPPKRSPALSSSAPLCEEQVAQQPLEKEGSLPPLRPFVLQLQGIVSNSEERAALVGLCRAGLGDRQELGLRGPIWVTGSQTEAP